MSGICQTSIRRRRSFGLTTGQPRPIFKPTADREMLHRHRIKHQLLETLSSPLIWRSHRSRFRNLCAMAQTVHQNQLIKLNKKEQIMMDRVISWYCHSTYRASLHLVELVGCISSCTLSFLSVCKFFFPFYIYGGNPFNASRIGKRRQIHKISSTRKDLIFFSSSVKNKGRESHWRRQVTVN